MADQNSSSRTNSATMSRSGERGVKGDAPGAICPRVRFFFSPACRAWGRMMRSASFQPFPITNLQMIILLHFTSASISARCCCCVLESARFQNACPIANMCGLIEYGIQQAWRQSSRCLDHLQAVQHSRWCQGEPFQTESIFDINQRVLIFGNSWPTTRKISPSETRRLWT